MKVAHDPRIAGRTKRGNRLLQAPPGLRGLAKLTERRSGAPRAQCRSAHPTSLEKQRARTFVACERIAETPIPMGNPRLEMNKQGVSERVTVLSHRRDSTSVLQMVPSLSLIHI